MKAEAKHPKPNDAKRFCHNLRGRKHLGSSEVLLALLGTGSTAFSASFAYCVLVFVLAAFFFAVEASLVSDLREFGQVPGIRGG